MKILGYLIRVFLGTPLSLLASFFMVSTKSGQNSFADMRRGEMPSSWLRIRMRPDMKSRSVHIMPSPRSASDGPNCSSI